MCISQKVKGVLMSNLQHIFAHEDEDIGRFSNLISAPLSKNHRQILTEFDIKV